MEIRSYKNGDELNFIKLDRTLEEHPWNRRDLSNWKWKYMGGNPYGESICVYCYLEDEIIGHFACIPLQYLNNGNIINVGNSIAMMVRKDFQNKGLIKYIGDKLFNITDQEIDFIYGIPNQRSYELHKVFFDYQDWTTLNFYYSKISEYNQFNLNMKNLIKINRYDDQYENFWNFAKLKYNFILNRNKNYMNWRYVDRKDIKYFNFKLVTENKTYGYFILKIYEEGLNKKGHIMDIITIDNDNEINSLIYQYIINIFKELNVDEIFFYSEIVDNLNYTLKEKLKINYRRNLIYRVNQKSQLPLINLINNKPFSFSMGDSLEIF